LQLNGITNGIATHEVNGTSHNGFSSSMKLFSEQNGFTTYHESELPRLFVWSAHEQAGLDRIGKSYAEYLRSKATIGVEVSLMERLSYTLNCRRSILPWKSFCIASSIDELYSNLEERTSKPIRSSVVPKLAFVFTGQGAQWYAMGRELLSHEIFRKSLQEADAFLKSLECPWSLLGEFYES
jgi:acyl transferase domain-containing protein